MTERNVKILVLGDHPETQFLTRCLTSVQPSPPGPVDLLSILSGLRSDDSADALGLMGDRDFLSFAGKTGKARSFSTFSTKVQSDLGWTDEDIGTALRDADILIAPERDTYPPDASHLVTSNECEFLRTHEPGDLAIVEDLVRSKSPGISPFLTQVIVDRRRFSVATFVMAGTLFREMVDWLVDVLASAELEPREGHERLRNDLVALLINGFIRHAKHVRGLTVRTLDPARLLLAPSVVRPEGVRSNSNQRSTKRGVAPATGPVHVVLAFDRGYAPHGATAIQSAIEASSTPSQLHFHVLQSGDLDESIQSRLRQSVEQNGSHLQFHKVDAGGLAWLPLNRDHISVASYYRLMIHRTLPSSIDRVIYLDSDTVVIDDLAGLWEHSLGTCAVGGCLDEGGLRQARRLSLPDEHRYFNAGVMIFDLSRLRRMDFENEVQSVFRRYGELITLQDQDLLNLVFCGEASELPLRWNANTRLYVPNELEPAYSPAEAEAAAREPGILHFTDRRKPWHDKCLNPMGELYWDVRSRTPWAETPIERARRMMMQRLRNRFSRSQQELNALFADLSAEAG